MNNDTPTMDEVGAPDYARSTLIVKDVFDRAEEKEEQVRVATFHSSRNASILAKRRNNLIDAQ